MEREGRWYCLDHDPLLKEERRAARDREASPRQAAIEKAARSVSISMQDIFVRGDGRRVELPYELFVDLCARITKT